MWPIQNWKPLNSIKICSLNGGSYEDWNGYIT